MSLKRVCCFLSGTRATIACPPLPRSIHPKYLKTYISKKTIANIYHIYVPFFGSPLLCFCLTQHVSSISIIFFDPPSFSLIPIHSRRQKLNQFVTVFLSNFNSLTAFLFRNPPPTYRLKEVFLKLEACFSRKRNRHE